jgi:hypothetical protein
MAAPDEAAPASSIRHDLAISEDEAQPSPPWGALPAEQYLIVGQSHFLQPTLPF